MSGRAGAMLARLGLMTAGLGMASAAIAIQGAPAPAGGAAPAAAPTDKAAIVKQGRELFANWSCGSCHSLADAGATGHVGPALDGDPSLTKELVVNRVTNGQGAMPSFGGQMSDQEIATIAAYVTQVAAKP